MTWVNAVVHGILLGGVYALLASGLALMFGVMRIINLAHGSLALVGAYMAFLFVPSTGHVSTYLALAPVLPGALVVGYLLQRTMLERSLRAGQLVPLLTTFGLLDRDREPPAVLLLARRPLARRRRQHRDRELAGVEQPHDRVVRRARRSASPSSCSAGCSSCSRFTQLGRELRATAAGRGHGRARRDQRARRLRAGDRDRRRDGGARRRLLRRCARRSTRTPAPRSCLRVRGRRDRRHRLALGHARRRDRARRRAVGRRADQPAVLRALRPRRLPRRARRADGRAGARRPVPLRRAG